MSKDTTIQTLPFSYNFDTVAILKALIKAHKVLVELKGSEDIIPYTKIENFSINMELLEMLLTGIKFNNPQKLYACNRSNSGFYGTHVARSSSGLRW